MLLPFLFDSDPFFPIGQLLYYHCDHHDVLVLGLNQGLAGAMQAFYHYISSPLLFISAHLLKDIIK